VITVGKFEALLELVERMVAENTSLFIRAGQSYKDQHRAASSRPLSADEAASVAAAVIGDDRTVEDRAVAFQASELRAYDEPDTLEVLAAAGVATAPAFMRVSRRVVALVEMPTDVFSEAYDAEVLDDAIDEAAAGLRDVPMDEARARAEAALQHFARAAGQDAGKGVGLLGRTVWQALQQAVGSLVTSSRSGSELLSGSPEPSTGPSVTSDVSPTPAP
jgi:hypothetical protein